MVNAFKLYVILLAALTSAEDCTCNNSPGEFCGTRAESVKYLRGDCVPNSLYLCRNGRKYAELDTSCSAAGCIEADEIKGGERCRQDTD